MTSKYSEDAVRVIILIGLAAESPPDVAARIGGKAQVRFATSKNSFFEKNFSAFPREIPTGAAHFRKFLRSPFPPAVAEKCLKADADISGDGKYYSDNIF